MGVKAQFVTGEFSGLIGGLQAEKFNIVANQIEITPKRKAALFLTQPYAYSALQLILRERDDSHYTSLNDMKGKSLAITLGSNYGEYAKKYPGVVVKTYPSSAEYIRDLVQGRVDAAINDRLYIPYLIKNSALPVKPGALLKDYIVEIGIAAKKGNPDFTYALENAMKNIRSNGTLTKISVKWFGTDVSQPLK
jgi:cystine transport system substrate-binding protein